MTGYSHILNAQRGTRNIELGTRNIERGTLNAERGTLQTTSSPVHFRPRYSRSFPHQPVGHNQSGK